jgi:DNA gyrase subunit A
MSEVQPPPTPEDRIEELNIERELQDSYLTYAMSTIMDRALPDVRDGLKPSQRRILVAINDLNLTPGRKHIKCAKIAGDTSGNYHPHGEAVIYPTLVRMAQDWSMRHTLIDGQGNFGSTDGDPPAAMRYTEARMAAPTVDLMADLEYDTVDFQPNYDERLTEPVVLPGKFPNLLVNGSTGIAVGMACNLLPHNLREICDAIVHVIDNPDCSLAHLLAKVQGPDFPTGGIICGRDGIIEGYRTGRGKLTLRAKLDVEEHKGGRKSIIVSELPYGIIRRSIIESVAECVKRDHLKDIADANDESGRQHKVRLVFDLKRDADPDLVIRQLYEYTPCQVTVSMINIALVNRQPRTMGLKELIEHYIAHRKDVVRRRTRFLLRKAQQHAHILEAQIFAVCDIDEVVKLIRSSKTRDEAIVKLRQRAFRIAADHPNAPQIPKSLLDATAQKPVLLSQAQAEAIGRMQLIQLVGLEIEKLVKEYRATVEQIEDFEAILASEPRLLDIIREDIYEIKEKYGDERRTQITGEVSDVSMEQLIAAEEVVVTVSHEGYIKRLPVDTYRSQGRGGRGIRGGETREGDFVEHLFVANTHDHLLFFTNQGRVYERRVYDVPQMSRTAVGRAVANLLEFQAGEKIANVLAVKDLGQESFLIFATARGIVKKTALAAYGNINRRGIIAIGLEEGDSLIAVEITDKGDQILLGSKRGMAIRFNESDARAMGRPAGGVKGIELEGQRESAEGAAPSSPPAPAPTAESSADSPASASGPDEVVSMIVIPADQVPAPDSSDAAPEPSTESAAPPGQPAADQPPAGGHAQVLTACVNGFGKRTPVGEYRLIRRGGKGVINIKTTDRNGEVVGMVAVRDDDEVILITERGILIRTRVDEIRETGRNAAGVRLIKLDEGDKLVALAKVDAMDADVAAPVGTAAPKPPSPAPNQDSDPDTDSPATTGDVDES